ncbi:MAG: iron ABC transporter permease [Alphaproteobacteria bacterium]|nr:iron ABC transporter permease [Alphaproteobacteria bacterium]
MRRRGPAFVASALVLGLLVLFIAYPIGAVLVESFVQTGPMPPARLKAVTVAALEKLPEDRRRAVLERWAAGATQQERAASYAAAFRLAGLDVPWDVKAAFADQAKAVDAALARLGAADRAAVETEYPVALAMLFKRIALAFQVRDALDKEDFERLRSGAEERLGLDHYLAVFADPYLGRAAVNSLTLAAFSALSTTALAFALSFGINRGGVPRPALVRGIVLLPIVAPPVLIATATVMLFGRRGIVTYGLLDQTLGVIDADATNLYGPVGVLLAQTLSFLPAATIVLDNVLRKHDGRLEEAAAGLGASRIRILGEVTLALAWPGIKRALVLVFILSLTDFGNPLILGRGTPVLAGVIYDEMTAFRNTPLAAALCVWLLAPSLLLFLILEAAGGRRRFAGGEGAAPEAPLPASRRLALGGLAAGVALAVLTVYATVALGAVTRIWGVDWSVTLGYFGDGGVDVGLSGSGYGSSDRGLGLVWQSVETAGLAALLGGPLAMAIAYVIERLRPPGANLIGFLVLVPAVLPGIIFGIGYIVAFNLPFGIKALSLTGTPAILVINIMFSNLFVGVLAGRAMLQRLDPAVDEAAEALGAGIAARFAAVTLPMLRPALLLGTLYVFVDGMTTLSSVIFLVSGDHKLASVAIFNHANSSEYGYAAAKSVAILVIAGLAMLLIWLYERRVAMALPTGLPSARKAARPAAGPVGAAVRAEHA